MDVVADEPNEAAPTEDVQNREVCYGMIQGAKVNCHIVPSPKPEHKALQPGWWPGVKIVLKRQHGDPRSVIHAEDF